MGKCFRVIMVDSKNRVDEVIESEPIELKKDGTLNAKSVKFFQNLIQVVEEAKKAGLVTYVEIVEY